VEKRDDNKNTSNAIYYKVASMKRLEQFINSGKIEAGNESNENSEESDGLRTSTYTTDEDSPTDKTLDFSDADISSSDGNTTRKGKVLE
jgi:hypothetical protein